MATRTIVMNNEINDLRNELIRHKHFTNMAEKAVQRLSVCLRRKIINDLDSMPGDRAALLDADLVMAEAYKLNQRYNEQHTERQTSIP